MTRTVDFRSFTVRTKINEKEECDELKSDLRESCIFISEISLLKKKKYTHKTKNEGEWNSQTMIKQSQMKSVSHLLVSTDSHSIFLNG